MTKNDLKNYRWYKELVRRYDRGVIEAPDTTARDKCARRVAAIEQAIASVPDPTAQLLLRLRYIEGRSWVQVRFALHYSESQTKRIHARALKMLEGVNIE